jgi:hypothetical protein
LKNSKTGERVLPVIMNDNYFTLMPSEMKLVTLQIDRGLCKNSLTLLKKQYNQKEKEIMSINFY